MTSRNEPRWDRDFADGYQGELFEQWAEDAIKSGASVEVKTDRHSFDSGNVYIERECQVSGQWVPSGIARTEAVMWAHLVVGPMVIFAPVGYVRYIANKYGREHEVRNGTHPTRGWVLNLPELVMRLADLGRHWGLRGGDVPGFQPADEDAPFGRTADGKPLAPYGLRKDGRPRLQPGGRRAERTTPPARGELA